MSDKQVRNKPELDKRFLIELQGKEYVKYEGLLDLAHQIGIKSLETDLIQIPSESNHFVAICKATITTHDDEVYVDYGDAAPNSVNSMLTPHIIRMSVTRAKARALRDLTNVGITAIEELGGDGDRQNGKQGLGAKVNSETRNKALFLQEKLMSMGKGRELGSITNGRRVESISDNELSEVIQKMEKLV